MTKLTRGAVFTDIHWGKRNSSEAHNNDCLNFVKWFCNVAQEQQADHVMFLGDWFEVRSSINIHTLNYAYQGMQLINELNVPVYMVVGNHDCYYRHSREVHSIIQYSEFNNVSIVDEPTVIREIGDTGALMCPYLFHHEYEGLKQHLHLNTWWGHFEFQGFVVTGNTNRMPTGPNAGDFVGPKIFSGHFHKRQKQGNVEYMGNAFPMDFGDSGDVERGMLIFDHTKNDHQYINWVDCPKYQKVALSQLTEGDPADIIVPEAKVRCFVDRQLTYEQSVTLKDLMVEQFNLKEFHLEETVNLNEVSRLTEVEISEDEQLEDTDHLVERLLASIQTDRIKSDKLIEIYKTLQVVD